MTDKQEHAPFYESGTLIVPFEDIQHVEFLKRGPYPPRTTKPEPNGLHVITSKTHYDVAADVWSNRVYVPENEAAAFIGAYKRHLEARAALSLAKGTEGTQP